MIFKKQEVRNAIERKLGLKPHVGKENNVYYCIEDREVLRITYPKGRGDLKMKTTRTIKRQTTLSWDDFIDLIKCPMTSADFERIIGNKIKQKIL